MNTDTPAAPAVWPFVDPADDPEIVRRIYSGRLPPNMLADAFRRSHELFASRKIAKGSSVRELPKGEQIQDLRIEADGAVHDLYDYICSNRAVGVLILKKGKIVFEHYEDGNNQDTMWVSMSMAKSVASLLVGAAIQDGAIESLDDPITRYVTDLSGTSFDGATIRNVLQMGSGTRWSDEHTDAASERRHVLELQIAQKSREIFGYMSSLPRAAAPGAVFNYSLADTHMIGELVRQATGRWLADYASEKIWGPMGAQTDAFWWLEAPDGLEIAGAGISAPLRDYARLGQFVLDCAREGSGPFPDGWIAETAKSFRPDPNKPHYGLMWWPTPDSKGGLQDGAICARGIFGQYIYINPAKEVVVAVNSCRAKPIGSHAFLDIHLFNAAAEQV